MDATTTTDPTMDAISKAVALGHTGDAASAQRDLLEIWDRIGAAGDPFHRCTLAHYLADLYDNPAQALVWDIRALDAAAALTDERTGQHHDGLRVAGFYPSLHLNIADDLRRLSAFDAAAEHIRTAERHAAALSDDAYGDMIRTAIVEVGAAIESRDTDPRASALASPAEPAGRYCCAGATTLNVIGADSFSPILPIA